MTYEEKLQELYQKTVPLINSRTLLDSMEAHTSSSSTGDDLYILDTRSPREFHISHLKGARMIDYDRFAPQDVVDIPKGAAVIVYCSVGYRSERIGEKLMEMGYKDVKNLYGGIFQWVNEGWPIVDSRSEGTDSVHTYSEKWSQWLQRGVKVYE